MAVDKPLHLFSDTRALRLAYFTDQTKAVDFVTTSAGGLTITPTVAAQAVTLGNTATLTVPGRATLTAGFTTTTGNCYIGDTSNANMTLGLTVNAGANDNQHVCVKNTALATGLTSATTQAVETDDLLTISKNNTASGGVLLQTMAEDAAVARTFYVRTYGGTADTTKTTAGTALMYMYASEHDGANALANITNNGNVFAVAARVGNADVSRFIVDEDGDLFAVNATITALDDEDDVSLIRAFELNRTAEGVVLSKWDEFVKYNEDDLIRVGVLGGPVAEGGMWNVTQHMRLLNGAAWQLHTAHQQLKEAFAHLLTNPDDREGAMRLMGA